MFAPQLGVSGEAETAAPLVSLQIPSTAPRPHTPTHWGDSSTFPASGRPHFATLCRMRERITKRTLGAAHPLTKVVSSRHPPRASGVPQTTPRMLTALESPPNALPLQSAGKPWFSCQNRTSEIANTRGPSECSTPVPKDASPGASRGPHEQEIARESSKREEKEAPVLGGQGVPHKLFSFVHLFIYFLMFQKVILKSEERD